MVKEYKIDDCGLLYFDDLYLDVVLLFSGKVYVLDEEELEDVYKSGDVMKEEYELVWYIMKWILVIIKNSEFYWILILEEEIEKLK